MLVCRFVGLVFNAIGQPAVIGEIIAGALRPRFGVLRAVRFAAAR